MAEQKELAFIDQRMLTPQIKWLVHLIGITQTYHFLSAFGGQRLSLPMLVEKFDHPIALVIGVDKANKICRAWMSQHGANTKFNVPAFNTMLLAMRKFKICTLAKTHSNNDVAKETGLTCRYVIKFIANHCCDKYSATKTTKIDYQPDLFNSVSVDD